MSTFQRGDKNIANASGQVVREDMEDTLKATAANNFGPLSGAGTNADLKDCRGCPTSDIKSVKL